MTVEKYCIVVGKTRPNDIKTGQVLKGSGQTALTGDIVEVNNQRGEKIIPNRSRCWGVRVIKDESGKIKKEGVDVTDKEYKGEIKFLKWGDSKGELIYTRHIRGYNSLDVIYQETRLNYKVNENDENAADAAAITLEGGETVFSGKQLETDRMLIEHLKHHMFNRDAECRPDDMIDFWFYEKTDAQVETVNDKLWNDNFEAKKIVSECASSTGKLKMLYDVLDKIVEHPIEDDRLLSHLKFIADTKPTELLKEVEKYKREVSDNVVKLDSFKAVDVSVDGKIVSNVTIKDVVKTGEILADGLECKSNNQLDYLYRNMFDEKCFAIQFRLNHIAKNLK